MLTFLPKSTEFFFRFKKILGLTDSRIEVLKTWFLVAVFLL